MKLRGNDNSTFQDRVFGGVPVPVSVDLEVVQGRHCSQNDCGILAMEELSKDSTDPPEERSMTMGFFMYLWRGASYSHIISTLGDVPDY
jgi:hypothetical protein